MSEEELNEPFKLDSVKLTLETSKGKIVHVIAMLPNADLLPDRERLRRGTSKEWRAN